MKAQQKTKEKAALEAQKAAEKKQKDLEKQKKAAEQEKQKEMKTQQKAKEQAALDAQKAAEKKQKDMKKAEQTPVMTKPVKEEPAQTEVSQLYNKALELYRAKDYEGALKKFKEVKTLNPGYARTNFYINSCEYIINSKKSQ